MVTQAKKPHPRKKRTRVEEPAAEMTAAPEMSHDEEALQEPAPQPIPSYSEPIAEEHEEAPSSRRAALEPTAFARASADTAATKKPAKRVDAFQDRSEQSDEPDFGLGIGDILRSDENLKSKLTMPERTDARNLGEDDGRLSIDSILRGETSPRQAAPAYDPEGDDETMSYMDHESESESGRSGAKTAALVILVLLLFVAAAGGVYMFLAKSGLPSFASLFKKTASAPKAEVTNTVPAGPKAPSSVQVTVLVGTTAPATPGAKEFIASRMIESDGKDTGTFPATGTASSKIDKSTGKATIVNTTSKAYTFVATTRLLSKEGVLFRMNATTPIPANGSVTVDVHADQAGAEGDIGPTTFTIPGLPPDLQKQITAKSDAAMTGGAGNGVGVSQSDIDAAKASLTEKLRKEAIDNFAAMLAAGEKTNPDMITSKEIAVTAPKVGTPGATFTLTLSLRFRALVVPEKSLTPLLDKMLADSLPPELSAADFTLGNYLYTVQAYDITAGTAEVRVEAPVIHN